MRGIYSGFLGNALGNAVTKEAKVREIKGKIKPYEDKPLVTKLAKVEAYIELIEDNYMKLCLWYINPDFVPHGFEDWELDYLPKMVKFIKKTIDETKYIKLRRDARDADMSYQDYFKLKGVIANRKTIEDEAGSILRKLRLEEKNLEVGYDNIKQIGLQPESC